MATPELQLFINPAAGRGRAGSRRQRIVEIFAEAGFAVTPHLSRAVGDLETQVRTAIDAGTRQLVVAGGDGSIHEAVNGIMTSGQAAALGVIPVGTGNDFVRGLDWIPDDPLEAAAVALHDFTSLDALRCGDQWTASVVTAGFSGDVNERAEHLRRPRGPSRYTVATILELPQLAARALELDIDGNVIAHRATMLAVANTAWFGGGMQIAPDADPSDGLLDVTVVDEIGRLELLRFFSRVFNGTHMSHPKVHGYRGRSVRITTDEPLVVWGDGECVGPTPCTIESVPGALRIAR